MNDNSTAEGKVTWHRRLAWWVWVDLAVFAVALLIGGFNAVYAGKVLPGVRADGVYLGGLNQTDAKSALDKAVAQYATTPIAINYNNSNLRLTPDQLGTTYDTAAAAKLAVGYGRAGNLFEHIHAQLRALFSRDTNVAVYNYDSAKLALALQQIDSQVAAPVQDAVLSANTDGSTVTPAQDGMRLDNGRLAILLGERLAKQDSSSLKAPLVDVKPAIDTTSLQTVAHQADGYLKAPITLKLQNGITKTIEPAQIAGWIQASRNTATPNTVAAKLESYYPFTATALPVKLQLDPTAVQSYVTQLSHQVDSDAVDAELTYDQGSNAVNVFVPSRNGYKIDQTQASTAISKAVAANGDARTVSVNVQTLKPKVTEGNLNDLGITQLISEGETFFPMTPAGRIQNVRTGASRFNNVLVAPGETFSFNKILGPVDAAHGFAPGLVIANNTEELQYGGGLCQVSSTMYRAALLAGLPITSRTNHSFVVFYYTKFVTTTLFGPNKGQTYSVNNPGLDATIYLPNPDFGFKNDTGHYILIKEVWGNGDLKFQFYGTATKYGVIRGPYTVSGNPANTHVPSSTVFYRDVFDLAGNLMHTDTTTTHYVSDLSYLPKQQD
jgi:vancomycin resistance protein YoaR